MMLKLALSTTAALALLAVPTQAAVTAHFEEVGGTQVHVTWAGSFDTSGLNLGGFSNFPESAIGDAALWGVVPPDSSGPALFGTPVATGFNFVVHDPKLPGTDSSTFGHSGSVVLLPPGTVSGDIVTPTGKLVFDTTLAELDPNGFLDDTQNLVFTAENGEQIFYTTAPAPVAEPIPEPSRAVLGLLGLLGAIGVRRRRR